MAFPWQTVLDGGMVVAIVGAILALGKRIGSQDREMEQLRAMVEAHETTINRHTASLADGEGNFKVIDTKLEAIKEGQTEIRDLLLKHITKGGE